MRHLKYIIIFAAAMLLIPSVVSAEGFIFKCSEDAVMALDAEADAEYLAEGFYTTDDEELLKQLLAQGMIEYYEKDADVYLMDKTDDPEYETYQKECEYAIARAVSAVNNKTYTGKGVRVGIIDTGLAADMEDINYDNIVATRDITVSSGIFATSDDSDDVTDTKGHGTSVAGVVAAKTNNSVGVASLAPDAELVIIKAFPDNSTTTKVSLLIKAVDYAIEQECDVINMSLGAPASNDTFRAFKEVVNKADAAGIIIVAAAGNYTSSTTNDTTKDSTLYYPASFDNVVSVASVDNEGVVSSFSFHNAKVNVAACGEDVRVLDYSGKTPSRSGNGTSYSSPFVASVAVLAKQIKPEITASEFLALLAETSTDAGDEGWDSFYGDGIINVGKLLDTMLGSNIVIGETTLDDNWNSTATIYNYGFDSYDVIDIFFIKDEDGNQYNRQTQTRKFSPRTSVTDTYRGWYTVVHMLWYSGNLEPVGAAVKFDTNIY